MRNSGNGLPGAGAVKWSYTVRNDTQQTRIIRNCHFLFDPASLGCCCFASLLGVVSLGFSFVRSLSGSDDRDEGGRAREEEERIGGLWLILVLKA